MKTKENIIKIRVKHMWKERLSYNSVMLAEKKKKKTGKYKRKNRSWEEKRTRTRTERHEKRVANIYSNPLTIAAVAFSTPPR